MPKYTEIKYADVTEKDFVDCPLWWHLKGLSPTASGYGSKIPTQYKVKHNNRLKRVYCMIYSNSGSLYIMHKGEILFIK